MTAAADLIGPAVAVAFVALLVTVEVHVPGSWTLWVAALRRRSDV